VIIGNVTIGNVTIGNVTIGNVIIGNVTIGNVIIGNEELLTNIIFLNDFCPFSICFNFNISSSTQHYNNMFINRLGSQNVL
jgi:hypothetical protein